MNNIETPFGYLDKCLHGTLTLLRSLIFGLKVASIGPGCKVLPRTIIAGGKNIRIGKNCFIGRDVVLDAKGGSIEIGDNVEIRDGVRIYAQKIEIGNGSVLAEGVFLNGSISLRPQAWLAKGCELWGDVVVEQAIFGPNVVCMGSHDHYRDPESQAFTMKADPANSEKKSGARVTVKKGAWVGTRSIVLKGITIAEGSLVGAGSVVTKNFPPYSAVAGNPAKPIESKI